MFRSILVPLDGTPEAAAALPLARTIAAGTGGALHLLTVTSDSDAVAQGDLSIYLDKLADDLRVDGVRCETTLLAGEASVQIVEYAHRLHTDLVVMATRAVGSRSILALTSVADHVLTKCPSPVLLLQPASVVPRTIGTLLVPIDGTPGGSLALAAARALSHAFGSRIVLLDVVVPAPAAAFAALPGMSLGGYVDPEWEGLARAVGRMYVESLARRINDNGGKCEARVATGEVAAEVLRCADEIAADLIVMSTHSVKWPDRPYMGSVAERVLREGEHPVLLVRREPPAGDTSSTTPEQAYEVAY